MSKLIIERNKLNKNPIKPAPEPSKIKILALRNFFFHAKIAPIKTEKAPNEAIINIGIKRNLTNDELKKS